MQANSQKRGKNRENKLYRLPQENREKRGKELVFGGS